MRFTEPIDAPIEAVFDFFADPRNSMPLLGKGVTVRQVPPGSITVGTTFIVQRGSLTSTVEVTAFERPYRMTSRSGSVAMDEEFRTDGERTMVTMDVPWPYIGVVTWATPLVAPFTPALLSLQSRTIHRSMDLARAALEPGPEPGPDFRTPDPWAWRRRLLFAAYLGVAVAFGALIGFWLA